MNEASFYNAVAIAKFGDYHAIKKSLGTHAGWEEAYRALQEKGESLPDPKAAFEELVRSGVQLILTSDSAYPPRLREISHPPHALYIKGNISALLHDPALAVVGTRRASPEGKNITRYFARKLADARFAIVSGLAFGIDAAAHEGCLETTVDAASESPAIAVLAGGLHAVYPHTNEPLSGAILDRGGALVSEYPMGEDPLARRFIERNRIVSGLARGVLVIEAPERSGALSTARFAIEQNRDVFVVPGNIAHANFKGSNRLIQQGATLVTSPDDILETYGIVKEQRTAHKRATLTAEESLVIDALMTANSVLDVDKIIIMTRLEPRIVNQALTLLLIKELVREEHGGWICS